VQAVVLAYQSGLFGEADGSTGGPETTT
jgi:hypothetical protein